jgi:hypothetical protein
MIKCLCGCGNELLESSLKRGFKYIQGHNSKINNPFLGKHHTEETKIKYKESMKYYRNGNPLWKQKCINIVPRIVSQTEKINKSNKMKQLIAEGKFFTIEHREKLSKATKETMKSVENRRIGEKNGMYGVKCPNSKRVLYNGISFRSTWEAEIAKVFDKEKIVWQYESKRFYYKNFTYLPDFYLPDYDLYIEVKGWIGRNPEDIIKINTFKKENSLLLIDGIFYKKIVLSQNILQYILEEGVKCSI